MTQPVARRADKIVVGDRIPDEYLAFRFNQGPAQAVFVAREVTQSLAWIFVAYRYPNGQHDSMTVRPEAVLEVFPAAPVGHDYSRADDGEQPGPVAGRIPPHFEDGRAVAQVGSGLVEIDPPEGFVPASAHPSWPTESELKPWESLAPMADRVAASMEPTAVEHVPGSVEHARHYLGLEESHKHGSRPECLPECGGGRQCRCQGGWS